MVQASRRKFHYIYKITRNNSDRYYIGMHSTDRMDDGYFGSGTRLWKSIHKYGKENHTMEILEFCESREQLKIREKEIIGDLWKLDEDCMNLMQGGGSGWDHINIPGNWRGYGNFQNETVLVKARETWKHKFNNDEQFHAKVIERVNKMAEASQRNNPNGTFFGKRHTEETKKKMSIADRTGEKNSQFGRQWIYNDSLKQCKRIGKEDPIPEGWKKGRKMKF